MSDKEVKGYVSVTEDEKALYQTSDAYLRKNQLILNQAFKGEVTDKEVTFPKELGAEHPFSFEEVEKTVNRIGIINGAVNTLTDQIMGDFTVEVQDENAQAILDDFINDSNFMVVLRAWIMEAVSKGNGFVELDLENSKIRVMNANNMYVKRNKQAKVLKYNQFKGKISTLRSNLNKVIEFDPNKIAHLPLNKVPNDPYGIGYVWPTMVAVNNYASAELSLHKLVERKAGNPFHVKVGIPGEAVNPTAIDSFKEKLQYMNSSTEWVTDGNVDIKAIDNQGIGENLTNLADHDIEQIAYGMNIPLVLLGKANVPEGLANAQEKKFQKTINAIRNVVESVAEERIFRPLLRNNNLDMNVEFTWDLPGDEEKEKRLTQINEALKNPFMSNEMKAALEFEYAQILGLEEVMDILKSPKEAQQEAEEEKKEMDRIRKQEEDIKQPEVPGAKPTARQSSKPLLQETSLKQKEVKEHICTEDCSCNLTEEQARVMTLAEYVNLTEIAGFNYSDYLIKILQKLKTYEFGELLANNLEEIELGLLPQKDVEKLRIILKDGFRKNKTIRDIERDIERSIDLKDRYTLQEDGSKKLALTKETRPLVMARTETVRLANAGLKDLYKENEIKQYRYLAALDNRTSEICRDLNGQIFNTEDGQPGINMPPMHVSCRSTIVGLVD